MTLLDKPRRRGAHRAIDRVRELEPENRRLAAENNEFVCTLVALAAEVDQLKVERDALAGAAEENIRLRDEITALRADLANATAVSDLSAALDDTVPIDVSNLRRKPPVVALWHSPLAASPTHIPQHI